MISKMVHYFFIHSSCYPSHVPFRPDQINFEDHQYQYGTKIHHTHCIWRLEDMKQLQTYALLLFHYPSPFTPTWVDALNINSLASFKCKYYHYHIGKVNFTFLELSLQTIIIKLCNVVQLSLMKHII